MFQIVNGTAVVSAAKISRALFKLLTSSSDEVSMYYPVESSLPRSVSPCHACRVIRVGSRTLRHVRSAGRLVQSAARRPIDRDAFIGTDSDSSTVTQGNVCLK
jgi:hypothetical protein